MRQFTLYIGLNDKVTKVQKISTIEAYKVVENALRAHFEGATIFEARGIYRHASGIFTTENTLRIELLEFDGNDITQDVKQVVNTLKIALNQESIAVQIQEVFSELW